MRKMTKKNILNILIIALILFTKMVLESEKNIKFVYGIFIISLVLFIAKLIKNKKLLQEMISKKFFLWLIFSFLLIFVYGFFGKNQDVYSLSFHILNFAWIFLLYGFFTSDIEINENSFTRNLLSACKVCVICIFTFILLNDWNSIASMFSGNMNLRIGITPAGNQNTTAISLVFLLIPILHDYIVKNNKKNIVVIIIGIILVLLTGSKKGIISLLIIFLLLYLIPNIKNKNKLVKILKILFIILIFGAACYYIPILHSLIWNRFESMFLAFSSNIEGETSTAIRRKLINLAFVHGWDHPLFGHGWGEFARLYGYSHLYQTNMYSHTNYTEIFFSFGLFGFLLYYIYPIKLFIKSIKIKDVSIKSLCITYIIVLLFIDSACVTCYSSIVGYLGFCIVSILICNIEKNGSEKNENKKN